MSTPTGLQWGYKFVGTDLATDDHQGGRFRYRLGEWHDVGGTVHNDPCPTAPGDGLCVARTLSGAQSGGAQLGSSVMLVVGFHAGDVLADSHDKVRVSRLWVAPDPVDPVAAIIGPHADLRGADLRYAYLRGADLRDANLRYADLRGADLRYAYLRGADLRDADLRGADLRYAYLRGAYLWDADLRGADLRGAYLWDADLRGADLRDAYLRGADLRGADLRDAYLWDAYLWGADLRGANLRYADLRYANLGGANLGGACGIRREYLPEGWMLNADGCVVEEDES